MENLPPQQLSPNTQLIRNTIIRLVCLDKWQHLSETITNGCIASSSVSAGQAGKHKGLLPPSYCILFLSPTTTWLWMGKHAFTTACYNKAVGAHSWSIRAGWDAGYDVLCCLSWVNETPCSFWVLLERIWAELKLRLTSVSSTRSTWDCFTCCLGTWSASWNLQRR